MQLEVAGVQISVWSNLLTLCEDGGVKFPEKSIM